MNNMDLASISKCVSLKDMVPGSVVEIISLNEYESEYGSFGMATFESTDAVGMLFTGRMFLPGRFIIDIENSGGLPAIYIYFKQVATSSEKVDVFYHDFQRVPTDPARPYSALFSISAHARELRAMPVNELRSQVFTNTLSNVETGATLVLYDLKYVKTLKNQKMPTVAFILMMSEEELKEREKERTGRLYLPVKCVGKFQLSDIRIARYQGLKKGKGARSYHDLVFVPSAWLEKEAVGGVANPKLLKTKASERPTHSPLDTPPAKTGTNNETKSRTATAKTQTLPGEKSDDDEIVTIKIKTTKSKAKKSVPLKEETNGDSDVKQVLSTAVSKQKQKPAATPLMELDKIRTYGPPALLHIPSNLPIRSRDDYLLDQYLESTKANEAARIDMETFEADLFSIKMQDPFALPGDMFESNAPKPTVKASEKIFKMEKVGTTTILQLPKRLRKSIAVRCMNKNVKTGKPYVDNLSFFRCLTLRLKCICNKEKTCICKEAPYYSVLEMYYKYVRRVGLAGVTPKDFKGVKSKNLQKMEDIFPVKIFVYTFDDNNTTHLVWKSSTPKNEKRVLNLNLYDTHFSLITRMDIYLNYFQCSICNQAFTRSNSLSRHKCQPPEIMLQCPHCKVAMLHGPVFIEHRCNPKTFLLMDHLQL